MAISPYDWSMISEFLNRRRELEVIETWWTGSTREPLAMLGRRRVGKSWLFRAFAHGKPALVLVAEQVPSGSQLDRFAEALEPVVGVRAALPDVATLFQVLYAAARNQKVLVVIDEFPSLLGNSEADINRTLSAIQATMENEASSSQLHLLLCGSQVGQMEALFGEKNPMHGRLRRFEVRPLDFAEARLFIPGTDILKAFERFAVTGGMPMYLSRLGYGSLESAICRQVLDPDGPLWNEGRAILDQELREPRVYFGILQQLGGGEKPVNEIAQALRMESKGLTTYLRQLDELRLASRHTPVGAGVSSRDGHWRLDDPFLRFWFRFVFPYQSDLETGLRPDALYRSRVGPTLADHVAPVFEGWCRAWLRTNRGDVAPRVGSWWGNAANGYRKTKQRSCEEIDAVGLDGRNVTLVGEAKWTNRQMPVSVLDDLEEFKVPALIDGGFRVKEDCKVVLFSRSGYAPALVRRSKEDPRIELVDVAAEMSGEATSRRRS